MHYLRLALLAEGKSDYQFLPIILRRLAVDLCARKALRPVTVEDEVLDLTAAVSLAPDKERIERIRETLRHSAGSLDIFFVHADGGGSPDQARSAQYEPWVDWTQTKSRFKKVRLVAVIPIREMEAWTLVDGDALRGAFGTVLADEDLGLPARPREVESILDPKRSLDEAHATVVGRKRRKKERAVNFLSAIGERVRLDCLRQVPAFQALERDLQAALEALGYFR